MAQSTTKPSHFYSSLRQSRNHFLFKLHNEGHFCAFVPVRFGRSIELQTILRQLWHKLRAEKSCIRRRTCTCGGEKPCKDNNKPVITRAKGGERIDKQFISSFTIESVRQQNSHGRRRWIVLRKIRSTKMSRIKWIWYQKRQLFALLPPHLNHDET